MFRDYHQWDNPNGIDCGQSYIEDCETCCNPIQIDYTTLESEIAYFEANSIEQ